MRKEIEKLPIKEEFKLLFDEIKTLEENDDIRIVFKLCNVLDNSIDGEVKYFNNIKDIHSKSFWNIPFAMRFIVNLTEFYLLLDSFNEKNIDFIINLKDDKIKKAFNLFLDFLLDNNNYIDEVLGREHNDNHLEYIRKIKQEHALQN